MYRKIKNPASILIVKISSLGDIIQAFSILPDLKRRFPAVAIDWVVDRSFLSLVAAHPLVRQAIALDLHNQREIWRSILHVRRTCYDIVIDLQGNCKSGLFTFFARGRNKVGYGWRSVREWPNLLATHFRFHVPKTQNIRLFYLGLIEQYFGGKSSLSEGIPLHLDSPEKEKVNALVALAGEKEKIMVCPGAKWVNKRLPLSTLLLFLRKIEEQQEVCFFLIWGTEAEKIDCQEMQRQLKWAIIPDKLPLPTWQNLMSKMDLILAVDSSALHLCGTTKTPSFSLFGPTSAAVFKPLGESHFALQGPCPYGEVFEKQCPRLRSCPTGDCLRKFTAESLFSAYEKWRRGG